MATPISNFSYTTSGLTVTFTDQSTDADGAITAWAWNFGDSNTASTQNPTHTYAAAGIYGVALQVTEGVETNTLIRWILVSASAGVIPVPIAAIVASKLPSSTLDMQLIITLIQKYQLLLQAAPSTPIPDAVVFDETAWPSIFNILISELVVWEILVINFGDLMLSSGVIGDTLSGDASALTQATKSVETGPAKVEFYDLNMALGDVSEAQANYYKAFFGKDGITQYLNSICMLANKVQVHLTICGTRKIGLVPIGVSPSTTYDGTNYYEDNTLTNL